jgi:predicted RNA binding protein YcfA (HicA-like mRNA interferase family)
MSFDELAKRFIEEPDRITPDECRKLLELLGYERAKKAGSEQAYHKKNSYPITIPTPHKGKYVKKEYVFRLVKLSQLERYLKNE